MKYNIMHQLIISILCLQSFVSFAQPGPDDTPCEARALSHFVQFTDSIEFRVNCFTKIDFENKMCNVNVAEGYLNTLPLESTKLLCVVYLENKILTDEIEIIKLFDDSEYRNKFIDRIQLIFVFDKRNGGIKVFKSKEGILEILTTDIRNRIPNL
jgi:hypothetical protein